MYKEDVKIYYHIKHNPRDIQLEALEFTKEQIRHGKKNILLNMPTGSGKSLFSIMFIKWYLNYINKDAKFDILTNSKILQQQYVDEFQFIANVKGRNSYRCRDYPDASCEEGNELNKAFKKKCHECPYETAQMEWINNRIGITNFHYFNSICLFKNEILQTKNPNVLIIDEAHDYEVVLSDFISNRISKSLLKRLGFTDSESNTIYQDIKFIKTVDEYAEYIKQVFINRLSQKLLKNESKINNHQLNISEKVKLSKSANNLKKLIINFETFLKDYENNPTNWVIDFEFSDDKFFSKNIIVQPAWSHPYLHSTIWSKYDHIIFLSGTLLNKEQFCYMNGLERKLTSYYEAESPFPLKNRPIYYIKIGKMTYDKKEETFKKQIEWIDKIIKRNKNNKGIIHTGNYEIAKWVEEYYGDNPRFIFHDSNNREASLQEHIASQEPTIIVSPSMMTGVDLIDDLSRFQIVLKIPYPNLKSAKVKKRMSDNPEWYKLKTVADFIQSIGRSVRSNTDFAETFVLDMSFGDILRYNHKYFPHYITEAIKILK